MVWKLLGLIHSLRKTKSINSQNLIYNLTMLKKDTGVGYYFGNILVNHLVTNMEACSLAREKTLTGTENTVAIRDFMNELTAKSLAAMEKTGEPAPPLEEIAEQTPSIETGETETNDSDEEPQGNPILILQGT